MPRASATHTQNETHTRSDSLLLYSGRGEWLTCGKFALGVKKEKKKTLWSSPLRDEKCNDSEYSALNYCLFTLPSPQPLTAPTSRHPTPIFTLVFYFLTPHLPLFLLYPPRASAREPVTLTKEIKQKKKKSFKGWKFPQNTRGEVGEWVEVQVEEYRGNVATRFLFDVSPLTMRWLIFNSSCPIISWISKSHLPCLIGDLC